MKTKLKLRRNVGGWSSTFIINPAGYCGMYLSGVDSQCFSTDFQCQMLILKEIIENNSFDEESNDALEVFAKIEVAE